MKYGIVYIRQKSERGRLVIDKAEKIKNRKQSTERAVETLVGLVDL